MYPETDVPPIIVGEHSERAMKKGLPELLDDKAVRFIDQYELSEDLADQIVHSKMLKTFERAVDSGADPKLAAITLTSTVKELRRKENIHADKISEEKLFEVFMAVRDGKIAKDSVPVVIKEMFLKPHEKLDVIIKNVGMGLISDEELRILVKKELHENKQLLKDPRGENILMGIIMRKVRGKIQGQKVMQTLREEMKKHG
jgi:glutamyl-tRNA(Gln) amidotransferase subunit E